MPINTPPGRTKKGDQALGRSRGGLSTKVHTVAVNERQVFGLILSGGQAGDAPMGEEMLAREEIKAVGADRAYNSDAIRAMIAAANKEAVIPPPYNRVNPPGYDREKDKGRNKVERLFNRLKHFRAVATRYDKLASMFLGGILAALIFIPLTRLAVNRTYSSLPGGSGPTVKWSKVTENSCLPGAAATIPILTGTSGGK